MTKLSLAAQAVAKAALYVSSCDPEEYPYEAQKIAAAALRAVANQGEIFFDAYDSPVQVVTVDDLLTIADELEAQ